MRRRWALVASRSQLSQGHFFDPVARALGQKEVGARSRRQDILVQVDEIDASPDRSRRRLGLRIVEVGILTEITARIAERRCSQAHEALDIPLLQQRLVGVQENSEVEKV